MSRILEFIGMCVYAITFAALVFLVIIGGAAAFSLLLAFPLMWTWNYVMPGLFGLAIVSWGQAWCLMWVTSSLIGVGCNKQTQEELKTSISKWLTKRAENKGLRTQLKELEDQYKYIKGRLKATSEERSSLFEAAAECRAIKNAMNKLLKEKKELESIVKAFRKMTNQ